MVEELVTMAVATTTTMLPMVLDTLLKAVKMVTHLEKVVVVDIHQATETTPLMVFRTTLEDMAAEAAVTIMVAVMVVLLKRDASLALEVVGLLERMTYPFNKIDGSLRRVEDLVMMLEDLSCLKLSLVLDGDFVLWFSILLRGVSLKAPLAVGNYTVKALLPCLQAMSLKSCAPFWSTIQQCIQDIPARNSSGHSLLHFMSYSISL